MKFNIYPQEFPHFQGIFCDSPTAAGSARASAQCSPPRGNVGELRHRSAVPPFGKSHTLPHGKRKKYRIFAEKRIPMKQPDHRPWKVLNSEYLRMSRGSRCGAKPSNSPAAHASPPITCWKYPDWVNVIACTDDGRFPPDRPIPPRTRDAPPTRSSPACATRRTPRRSTPHGANSTRRPDTAAASGKSTWCSRPTPPPTPTSPTRSSPPACSRFRRSTLEASEDLRIHLFTLRRGAPAARRELHPASTDGRPSVALRRRTLRTAVTPPRRSAPPTAGKLSAGSLFFGEKAYIC